MGGHAAPVVRLTGDLDITTVARVSDQFADHRLNGHRAVIVDLTEVTFLDSTILGVLIAANREREVVVRGATADVRQVFAVTGLDRHLRMEDPPATSA